MVTGAGLMSGLGQPHGNPLSSLQRCGMMDAASSRNPALTSGYN